MRPANDNLYIPEFLRRPNEALDEAPLNIKTKRIKPALRKPPRGKKWKDAELVSVWLNDECPKIGCGVRRVWAKRGRVWVYMHEIGSGNRGKLKVETFNRLIYPRDSAA